MAASGIHGKFVEITVVGCSKLKNTEWLGRQDPYVCLEYGSDKFRTRTCTDGGRKAAFQEKFVLTLIEGLREVQVSVFNENTVSFIGSGKVQLHKVLSTGFDDSSWPLQSASGRFAGKVRLIMHYSYANRPATGHTPTYGAAPRVPPHGVVPPVSPYGVVPPVPPYGVVPSVTPYGVASVSLPQKSPYQYAPPSQSTYVPDPLSRPKARPSPNPYQPQRPPAFPPPPPSQGVNPLSQYTPPPPSNYPPSPYPPPPSDYPPSPYPPPSSDYPPSPYPPPSSDYVPSTYPPPSSTYHPSPYPPPSRDAASEPDSSHFGPRGMYRPPY